MQDLSLNTTKTMSSTEIAELTGKEKSNIHRDIKKLTDQGFVNTIAVIFDPVRKSYIQEIILSEKDADLILNRYDGLNRVPNRLAEESALKTIEQLLNITLERQFSVLHYKVDGYDSKNNIVYEIDEKDGHSYKQSDDLHRQRSIEKKLNCTFVRIVV